MSATEALQLKLDNLRHQVHQVQVRNEKLKLEVSNGQGDKIEQLQVEAGELQQSLHDAQEREVSSNELLHKNRTEYHELKSQYDNMVLERAVLSMELTDYRAGTNKPALN